MDFELQRRAVLAAYRRGRLARHDICDAQAELMRAARNCGVSTDRTCPVCREADVVHVSYAFGRRLPRQGRCVTERAELARLEATVPDLTYYVVEVCPRCRWNHLARRYDLGSDTRR